MTGIMLFVRLFFVLASTYACWHLAKLSNQKDFIPEQTQIFYASIGFIISVGIIIVEVVFKRKFVKTLIGSLFGLVIGIIMSYVMVVLVRLWANVLITDPKATEQFIGPLVPIITVLTCYLSVSIVFQTRDEFRFIIPYVDFSYQGAKTGGVILDTSAIIDGRIADVFQTRIIKVPIILPKFVLSELQRVADSSDKIKRSRGRRGLDILKRIQNDPEMTVIIHDEELDEIREVDDKLIKLAKILEARIITTDFNLNKVAAIEGITVINLNDLANALKPYVIPGETIDIKLIKPGEDYNQAVGYLDDGTMVVAENGRKSIGDKVTVNVTSVLQTSAGRMIFGRIAESQQRQNNKRNDNPVK